MIQVITTNPQIAHDFAKTGNIFYADPDDIARVIKDLDDINGHNPQFNALYM